MVNTFTHHFDKRFLVVLSALGPHFAKYKRIVRTNTYKESANDNIEGRKKKQNKLFTDYDDYCQQIHERKEAQLKNERVHEIGDAEGKNDGGYCHQGEKKRLGVETDAEHYKNASAEHQPGVGEQTFVKKGIFYAKVHCDYGQLLKIQLQPFYVVVIRKSGRTARHRQKNHRFLQNLAIFRTLRKHVEIYMHTHKGCVFLTFGDK